MLAAFEGALAAIDDLDAAEPGKDAVVFITDGVPALCPEVNGITPVAQAAASAAARVSTYVIGITNPVIEQEPNPPDFRSDFDDPADAGGTDQAFVIETGFAPQTSSQVRAALDTIGKATASCEVLLPEGFEGTLDEGRVALAYARPDADPVALDYDPECTDDDAWRFDDENQPASIILCDGVCQTVRNGAGDGHLLLDPGCQ